MIRRLSAATLVLALLVPGALQAQKSGSGEGRYANFITDAEEMEMPGGGTMALLHYRQMVFATQGSSPADGLPTECVGQFVSGADGKTTAANGTCFGDDGAGNGLSYWFRMDAAGTADCPDMCGTFAYFAGYGKFAGITGEGTWRRAVTTPTSGHGTWKASYAVK